MGRDAEFDQLADELYARPPAEFIAARDARAKAARAAGDSQLADALRALRKPTTAAWLANALVRERPRKVGRLLELGDALRRAQAAFDADALRRLTRARRDLIGELSSTARELAAAEGADGVGTSTLRELDATLEAALLEPRAAEELRRGRLTGALSYSGLGFPSPGAVSEESSGEPIGSAPTGRRRQASSDRRRSVEEGLSAKGPGGKGSPAEGSSAASAVARRRAQREADDARRALTRADRALAAAQREADEVRTALAAAEAEVGRRREAVRAADRELRRARGERDAAEREVRRAAPPRGSR